MIGIHPSFHFEIAEIKNGNDYYFYELMNANLGVFNNIITLDF